MGSRVLVTEALAATGLELLRAEGLEVDVRTGLSPKELVAAVWGASALVIRSATRVTAEVLEAGSDLVIVGRAGIGVDNIDVAAATRRGVIVANAPQSNVLSAAEHAMALLLALARHVPQAHADLRSGHWDRSRFAGVELHGKVLGVLGLGRVGSLVAQRALAFGMRVLVYDTFLSPERARQMAVELVPSLATLVAQSDFLSIHLPRTSETIGLLGAEVLASAKPGMRIVNTARGGILDEVALADAIRSGHIAGAALDVFAEEPTTTSPLFELDSVVVTPHLGASTAEAQDKAGRTIAEQVVLALRGDFVPSVVNVAAGEASDIVRRFLPLAERLGRLCSALVGGVGEQVEVSYEGPLASQDCRLLTLAVLKGVIGAFVHEPVSFVNAPNMAAERGIDVRETKSSSSREYVNLVTVRGGRAERAVSVAGTLAGKAETPRIVLIDDHTVDVPPAAHMLVVRNEDQPGVIGRVGTILGEAGINIADMGVGRGPGPHRAIMVLATDSPVGPEVIERLRSQPGITDARAIELE